MISRLLRFAYALPAPVRRLLRRVPGLSGWLDAVLDRPRAPLKAGSKRPVVYLPTWVTWGQMRQRPQYLLAAFAEAGHPTFLVDPRSAECETPEGIRIVSSLQDVPHCYPILYVHYAGVRTLFEQFVEPVVVYDVLDDLSIYDAYESGMPEGQRVRAHHGVVVTAADVVIASSRVLVDRHSGERPDLMLVENGVDPTRFGSVWSRPNDMLADRPIVGYHGAVDHRFDFPLFESVARANPQWRFVVVGPVASEASAPAKHLEALDNVDLLGERPSDDIAGYVQAFDVGAIWFVMNYLTEAINPLKMYEYLAAGVPVVATPLPACRDVMGVSVAADADQFTRAIRRALDGDWAERRRMVAVAEEASWDARLAPLLARLEDLGLARVPD